MGEMAITAGMHITHHIGNALGVGCTACGHKTSSHTAIGFGVWRCDCCGSRCYSIFGHEWPL